MTKTIMKSRARALSLSLSAGAAIALAACSQQPATETETPNAAASAPATAEMNATAPSSAAEKSATARGVITAVDAAGGKITIEHEPIANLGWPAMTMGFAASPALVGQARIGDRVEFDVTVKGSAGEVTAIRPQ